MNNFQCNRFLCSLATPSSCGLENAVCPNAGVVVAWLAGSAEAACPNRPCPLVNVAGLLPNMGEPVKGPGAEFGFPNEATVLLSDEENSTLTQQTKRTQISELHIRKKQLII